MKAFIIIMIPVFVIYGIVKAVSAVIENLSENNLKATSAVTNVNYIPDEFENEHKRIQNDLFLARQQKAATVTSFFITLIIGGVLFYLVFYSPMNKSGWCALVNVIAEYFFLLALYLPTEHEIGTKFGAPFGFLILLAPMSIVPFVTMDGGWWLIPELKYIYLSIIILLLVIAIIRVFKALSQKNSVMMKVEALKKRIARETYGLSEQEILMLKKEQEDNRRRKKDEEERKRKAESYLSTPSFGSTGTSSGQYEGNSHGNGWADPTQHVDCSDV